MQSFHVYLRLNASKDQMFLHVSTFASHFPSIHDAGNIYSMVISWMFVGVWKQASLTNKSNFNFGSTSTKLQQFCDMSI